MLVPVDRLKLISNEASNGLSIQTWISKLCDNLGANNEKLQVLFDLLLPPSVVGALSPAVSAPLEGASSTLDPIKKPGFSDPSGQTLGLTC